MTARPCWQIRPTPPHLTSAMAENILAAACESETRNAAKRMRLDAYQATVNVSAVFESAQEGFGSPPDHQPINNKSVHYIKTTCCSFRMSSPPSTNPSRGIHPPLRHRGSPFPAQLLLKTNSTPTEASTTTCGDTGPLAATSRTPVLPKPTVSQS